MVHAKFRAALAQKQALMILTAVADHVCGRIEPRILLRLYAAACVLGSVALEGARAVESCDAVEIADLVCRCSFATAAKAIDGVGTVDVLGRVPGAPRRPSTTSIGGFQVLRRW
jgi:hypothetical protein